LTDVKNNHTFVSQNKTEMIKLKNPQILDVQVNNYNFQEEYIVSYTDGDIIYHETLMVADLIKWVCNNHLVGFGGMVALEITSSNPNQKEPIIVREPLQTFIEDNYKGIIQNLLTQTSI
jgi:hypothetical protein